MTLPFLRMSTSTKWWDSLRFILWHVCGECQAGMDWERGAEEVLVVGAYEEYFKGT